MTSLYGSTTNRAMQQIMPPPAILLFWNYINVSNRISAFSVAAALLPNRTGALFEGAPVGMTDWKSQK